MLRMPQPLKREGVPAPLSAVAAVRRSEGTIENNGKDVPLGTSSPTHKSESKLRLQSKGSVVVMAREVSAATELRENPSSLERLIRSGSLFSVDVGTAVAARQMEGHLVKVRIMEGNSAGQEGWVDISQVITK